MPRPDLLVLHRAHDFTRLRYGAEVLVVIKDISTLQPPPPTRSPAMWVVILRIRGRLRVVRARQCCSFHGHHHDGRVVFYRLAPAVGHGLLDGHRG